MGRPVSRPSVPGKDLLASFQARLLVVRNEFHAASALTTLARPGLVNLV